jgi:putative membrane protein
MMNWYGTGMGGWGYLLMIVNTLLFWGLIVAGVVVLVRFLGRTGRADSGHASPPGPQQPGPERILAERFARGEIDEEEYQRRLGILRGAPPT